MQQPVLYSASASLDNAGGDESTRWQLTQQPNNDNDDDDIVLLSYHVVMPSHPLVSSVTFRGVIHKIKSDY